MGSRHLLLLLVGLLITSNAYSAPTDFENDRLSGANELNDAEFAGYTRLLRLGHGEDGDLDILNSEERAGAVPGLSTSVTKTSKVAGEVLKLKSLAKTGKSVDEVKALLGLDKLTGSAFTSAKNFKLYDDYVSAEVKVWAKQELSVGDVFAKLGLNKLTGLAVETSPNFKYYDKFLNSQIPIWVKMEQSPQSPREVWAILGLGKMSDTAYLVSPNYRYYTRFMQSEMESWALKRFTVDDVRVLLGLDTLEGKALIVHPNYKWLKKFATKADKYRFQAWQKQVPTYDMWMKLGLDKVSASKLKQTTAYDTYARYVDDVDKHILEAMKAGRAIPNVLGKKISPAEMNARLELWQEARRSAAFVKFALGLNKLKGSVLRSDPANKYYEKYLVFLWHNGA